MKPKSRGAGIMISDFIDEHSGLLSLTDEEYERAKQVYPSAKIYSCRFLEYGENREGYWICDKFIDQINSALETAELKYPKEEGCRHVWVFDHSSCHAAMVDNTLIANKMNINPGGEAEEDEEHSLERYGAVIERQLWCTQGNAPGAEAETCRCVWNDCRPNEVHSSCNG